MLSSNQISERVKKVIEVKGLSLRGLSNALNTRHREDIESGHIPEFNKDFILRVREGNFSTVNQRVSLMCDMLGINTNIEHESRLGGPLHEELQRIEMAVSKKPQLEHQLRALLNNIVELAIAKE